MKLMAPVLALVLLSLPQTAHAVAYGSINNFDAVNDNGVPAHGFEIEIDGAHSTDVTYTYDWNHYGVPKITEDNSDPLVPKVFIRYESAKNPDGSWAAYTAVPSGPISPTDGHQFTDPSVNFGGEHFGAGFYGTPQAVKYHWLIDDGSGHLVDGTSVNIATPSFTYIPPVNAAPPQVQAIIVPPPPPAPPVMEFGTASWVKVTTTASHNNGKVELRDLVSDDPNNPNDRNWMNGEAAEVEVEWQILQTEFAAANGGANGEQDGVPEDLANGDEVITRRYDFYKYAGPIDPDTGEALADTVGADGIHGVIDYANTVIVGDYIGAQMAGFDAAGKLGLIDHLQDGEINVPYVDRTLVISGTPPITTTRTDALPDGMAFDEVTGILSGTPTVAGTFTFKIHSTDSNAGDVTQTYTLTVVDSVVPPVHITVHTQASPAEGGTTTGDGEYLVGANVTVSANHNPGFAFVNWTDGGTEASADPSYQFTGNVNRELVANFVQIAATQDQQQFLYNGGTSARTLPGYTVWQSFTAGISGTLTEIDMGFFNNMSGRGQLQIFAGDGTGGAILQTLTVPVVGITQTPVTWNAWAVNVPVTAGQMYTFNLTPDPATLPDPYGVAIGANNPYPGGVMGLNDPSGSYRTNFDIVFRTHVEPGQVAKHTVTTSASPSAGGSTSGDGPYNTGDSVTVAATENPGYHFFNWTENGAVVSTSSNYTFTVGADRNLVANFTQAHYYVISTSASPAAEGSTGGGGTFNSADPVTVTATANPGYYFLNWTVGGNIVSASSSYSFTASANRDLVANFARITFVISTSASPSGGGTATGGGTVNSGDSVTVVASANSGYSFLNWTEGGVAASTDASYTFAAGANRDLVANFTRITFVISTTASPVAGGTTTGGGTVNSGDSITVIATANSGYSFLNWTEGGVVASTDASYTFAAVANRDLVANFTRITFAISTGASPEGGGTTTGGGTVNSGDSVTVIATANSGYSFLNWAEGGAVVSTDASYTFTPGANRDLVANFSRITFVIGTSASPEAGGSATGGGTVNSGDSVTVVATANSGYSFLNWTEGGTVVSTSSAYTFTAGANRYLVANFARITFAVSASTSQAAGGTVTGGSTVNSGDSVTLVATANPGYSFLNWTEGGVVVSTSSAYTFTAGANRSLQANFTPSPTNITIRHLRMLSNVFAGFKTFGVIILSAPAPAGGTTVALASSNADALQVPDSVFVPAGRRFAFFKATAGHVRHKSFVYVTATLGNSKRIDTLNVIPWLW